MMIGLAWFTTASVQTGESFDEVAALVMLTDTPLFEWFFTRQMAEVRVIIMTIAAPVPIRGHLNLSKSDGDDGRIFVSEMISLLTKTVLLMFIFSSSNFCSTISIL